ncbi:translocation/assembly module TamB domain-containing protein [Haloflavibacter putidus]|uniref:translocation/assembly module TamB domain-containing protein n=1 Tax=Haloflavibacter putidus TaxID=2576776 RepID=UPI001F1DC9D4|nr:translocation/assembly module TamB domain-containing protein [Haloflavibacter putidus]
MLLFIVLFLVFSIPGVQTSVAKKIVGSLNQTYGTDIRLNKISLSYDGNVVLDEVYIADHHQDTLISAQELETSILNLPGLLSGQRLDFGDVTAQKLKLRLVRYEGEDSDNISIFADKFDDGKPNTNNFKLSISHIIATNSEFSYEDRSLETPEIISLSELNINAKNLLVAGKDVFLDVNTMCGKEKRGLVIDNLSTNFAYTSTKMELQNLHLETPQSTLNGSIVFLYDNPEQMGDFENKVKIKANFDKTEIATSDLHVFYDELGSSERIVFSGEMQGTLNNFSLENLQLRGMDRTVIAGNLQFDNIFTENKNNFAVSGDFTELATNYYDLANLLPNILGNNLPKELRQLGNINLQGYLKATPTTVSTNSKVNTQLGSANLQIDLGDLHDPDFATYKGKVRINNFNLGKLLGNKNLGKASFTANVDGSGLTQQTLNTSLNGTINNFTFNDYTYNNIEVLGVVRHSIFNGKLVSDDPNLKLEFNGLADVSTQTGIYDFKADVNYADLHALNFVKRDTLSVFKGLVSMNMRGENLNDARGQILLQDASYKNQENLYEFDQLRITSSFDEEVRTIQINSPDIIDGEIVGKFNIREIPAIFENALGSLYTNYSPIAIESDQYLDFNFDVYNKIIEVVLPDITLAPNTFIKGRVESTDSDFKLTFKSPQIKAYGNTLENVNLQVDNTNPLFNTFIDIDSVSTGFYNFSKVNLINVTLNDTLFVRSELQGGSNNNDEYNLSFYHTINEENKSVVGIRKSNVKFKESTWFLNPNKKESTQIVFDKNINNFQLDTLVMRHKNELIRLSGAMRDSTSKNFKLDFTDVDLAKITPDIENLKLSGTVNGDLHFLQEEGVFKPTSSLKIKNIGINTIDYGNLKLEIAANENLTKYNIDALLGRDEKDFLSATGSINVAEENPSIDLDVELDKFALAGFSALGTDVVSNIRGFASGQAKVSGNYTNPDIEGSLRLSQAGIKIPYLEVDLDMEENALVNLKEQRFIFENIKLTDTKYNTKGILNGSISHNNFSKWRLDLNLSAPERLLVLDTEAEENSLYYGTAFISGNATLTGPTDELVIDVNAKTQDGTIFKIPLNDTESIGDHSFIYFITPEEKAALQAGEELKIKEVKGLELFFELDVTNDAQVEIVVDQNSGSSLKGNGAGTLLIEINTNGKFNMWGDFVVYEGVYNFKYAGLVQKEFEVVSGGNITWDGSPTRADLNVSALYRTEANPAILLENPTVNRNIPVEVYIDLTGQLTATDLEFDLKYPTLSSMVKSELEYRISDRQNTEIQALSLITQGSFYSQYATGQNAITGNLFERASGLFNDIFSDEDAKFEVGINYTQGGRTPDQDTADRFGVTLSTQISKRILINGKVGVPIGGVTESVVVGDVEVELLLNEEGNLRAKLFNRENEIQYIGEELGYKQGVGLSYSVDFDTFKELIHKVLNKDIELNQIPEEVKEQADKESLAPDYIKFPGN